MDKLFWILLGLFLTLYGVFAVTNLAVTWGATLCGFAALAAGIVAFVRALR